MEEGTNDQKAKRSKNWEEKRKGKKKKKKLG